MMNLQAMAHALGGDVHGQQVLAPGLGHSRRDRSLSIRLDPRAPGGILVHSFAGDDPLAAKDHVRAALALKSEPGSYSLPWRHQLPHAADSDDPERTARALSIWSQSLHPRGTCVEVYLRQRGLGVPNEAAGEAIRFHPSCPFARERTPAMVCLVRDVITNESKAIHRTAISSGGRKVEVRGESRLSLGPIGGGAIKLTPDEEVTTCLGIGEGVETTLSMTRVPEFGTSPVWSLLSEGGIRRLPSLRGVECLWIAVDHDPAGLNAARETAERWRACGAEAFLITPSAPRADLNDVFGAPHA